LWLHRARIWKEASKKPRIWNCADKPWKRSLLTGLQSPGKRRFCIGTSDAAALLLYNHTSCTITLLLTSPRIKLVVDWSPVSRWAVGNCADESWKRSLLTGLQSPGKRRFCIGTSNAAALLLYIHTSCTIVLLLTSPRIKLVVDWSPVSRWAIGHPCS